MSLKKSLKSAWIFLLETFTHHALEILQFWSNASVCITNQSIHAYAFLWAISETWTMWCWWCEAVVKGCKISLLDSSRLSTLYGLFCHVWGDKLWTKWGFLDWMKSHFGGSAQDCSNSIANALELLQSCTKPSIWCSWTVLPKVNIGAANEKLEKKSCMVSVKNSPVHWFV